MVESQENVQGVSSFLLLPITLKVYTKILENYWRLHEIENNGKTSYYIDGWISHDAETERDRNANIRRLIVANFPYNFSWENIVAKTTLKSATSIAGEQYVSNQHFLVCSAKLCESLKETFNTQFAHLLAYFTKLKNYENILKNTSEAITFCNLES